MSIDGIIDRAAVRLKSKKYFSVDEAAIILGVSRTTIREKLVDLRISHKSKRLDYADMLRLLEAVANPRL